MVTVRKIYKGQLILIILISLGINLSAQRDTTMYKYYLDGTIKTSRYSKSTRLDTTPPHWDTYEELTAHYENGQKRSFEVRRNGKQDSLYIEWYDNGQKSFQSPYKMGKRHGIFLHWRKTGELWTISYFEDDKQEGKAYSFLKDGNIASITNYKDSLAHGKYVRYYENGNISSKANFVKGKGTVYSYDKTGKLEEEHYLKQFPFNDEDYFKVYLDDGYKICFKGIYGVYQVEYYDKNNVKYKIVKIDKEFNKEVIDLKEKE